MKAAAVSWQHYQHRSSLTVQLKDCIFRISLSFLHWNEKIFWKLLQSAGICLLPEPVKCPTELNSKSLLNSSFTPPAISQWAILYPQSMVQLSLIKLRKHKKFLLCVISPVYVVSAGLVRRLSEMSSTVAYLWKMSEDALLRLTILNELQIRNWIKWLYLPAKKDSPHFLPAQYSVVVRHTKWLCKCFSWLLESIRAAVWSLSKM